MITKIHSTMQLGFVELVGVRASVTVGSLTWLVKTVADKINFLERRVMTLQGDANDWWRVLDREILGENWSSQIAAQRAFRAQISGDRSLETQHRCQMCSSRRSQMPWWWMCRSRSIAGAISWTPMG